MCAKIGVKTACQIGETVRLVGCAPDISFREFSLLAAHQWLCPEVR